MRTFELHRMEDATGISGLGIIAEGVEFGDGTCALRWKTDARSTAVYDDLKTLEKIHGHQGKTKVVFTGDAFERGFTDATLDSYENAPFASVGGEGKRSEMVCPASVSPEERGRYLSGYAVRSELTYGKDWRTCEFGWVAAITLGGEK